MQKKDDFIHKTVNPLYPDILENRPFSPYIYIPKTTVVGDTIPRY